jgi:transcriptional regulator with XRE-family HTH domain
MSRNIEMQNKKANELDHLNNVSKRLKYVVDTLGVKQSHMAQKLGISPSGLHYILNNDVKFSKSTKKIADYLNVNENWIMNGEGEIYEENTSIKTYKIPVYYPDQLKLLQKTNKSKQKITTNDFMVTTSTYPNKIFGIYITEDDFSPKFEPGDMVAFEQTQEFKDGEILLAYITQDNSLELRYGFHINKDVALISRNGQTKRITPNEENVILGAYRESIKKTNF